jgi:predicted ATPase with chaperone activity
VCLPGLPAGAPPATHGRYLGTLSGPLLDRIGVQVTLELINRQKMLRALRGKRVRAREAESRRPVLVQRTLWR